MARYRIISEPSNKTSKKEETQLNDYEERKYRLSHGLYEFLDLDIMPTETNLLSGKMGLAFIRIWKLRKRRKKVFSMLTRKI
jgi:hypothetical protein